MATSGAVRRRVRGSTATAAVAALLLCGAVGPARAGANCFGLRITIQGSGPISGTPGDDVILGSNGNDQIYGGGGNDTIDGGYSDAMSDGQISIARNWLDGGPGDDVVTGGRGEPGAAAENDLLGGIGADYLTAGDDAANRLDGGRDNNIDVCVHSRFGDDTFSLCDVEQ